MALPNQQNRPIHLMVSEELEKQLPIDRIKHGASRHPESGSSSMINYWDPRGRVLYHVSADASRVELDDLSQDEGDGSGLDDEVQQVMSILMPSPAEFDISSYKQDTRGDEQGRNDTKAEGAVSYNRLCQECRVLTQNSIALETRLWRTDYKRRLEAETHEIFRHHQRLGSLQQSTSAGCHFCTLLLKRYLEDDRALPLREDKSYVVRIIFQVCSEYHKTACIQTSTSTSKPLVLSHTIPAGTPSPSLQYANTGHPEVLSLAKEWLGTCLTSHESCNESGRSKNHFVPTRLVEVTRTFDGAVSARLVVRDEVKPGVPYLALSYCWGGQMPCTLSMENISQFRQILPRELPKTLSDAFSITLSLKYNYIWIDALCIVQDSRLDWEQEAASMGSVYQYSVCTIAAVGAGNVHVGCFFERQPLSFLSCRLLGSTGDGSSNDRKATDTFPNFHSRPLHTRAWVFQERALSPRTINFEADQISWDCLESCSSEADASEHAAAQWTQDFTMIENMKIPFRLLLQPTNNTPDEKEYLAWGWHVLVTKYLQCDLTYPEDKWQAIQGLATTVSDAWGVGIVHGLWLNRLSRELLWSSFNNAAAIRLPNAPTWSWTSIHGDINIYTALEDRPMIDATVTANVDCTNDRVLQIEGSMVSMQYQATQPESRHYFMIAQDENTKAFLDRSTRGTSTFDMLTGDVGGIKALQIAVSPQGTAEHNNGLDHPHSYGLVIKPSDRDATIWHRVGNYTLPLIPERLNVFRTPRSKVLLI